MRVTRRSLKAEATQLRAQLAATENTTRKSLNDMVRQTLERNAYLMKEIEARDTVIARFKAEQEAAKQQEAVAA